MTLFLVPVGGPLIPGTQPPTDLPPLVAAIGIEVGTAIESRGCVLVLERPRGYIDSFFRPSRVAGTETAVGWRPTCGRVSVLCSAASPSFVSLMSL